MPGYDAFLLVSFGGPEGPDDVLPFLRNVTSGRGVPPARLAEVAKHYQAYGGVSPINQQCRDMLAAITGRFAADGVALPVYWGNRNWDPYLTGTVRTMAADGVRRAIAFATSAYSSYSSCRQYLEDIERARACVPGAPVIDKIRPYYRDEAGFIEPFTESVLSALASLPAAVRDEAHLVFTAHSIPVAMARVSGSEAAGTARPGPGGRYAAELTDVSALIAERAGPPSRGWRLVFQSRSGSPAQPWLEPDVSDHLRALAKDGVPAAVVVPVGFVSDHMEVVHDLDTEAARTARELGMAYARAATPGTSPRFIEMISRLVTAAMASPPACSDDCCRYVRGGSR